MFRQIQFKSLIYIQQFLGDCMPIYPLYALMFAQQGGLDNTAISYLFIIWVLIAMVAEVPTGIIADRMSRKQALMYSYLLQAAAFLVWLAVPSFGGYAAGFVLWGIGYAFSSGTFQAYLYEELKAQGDKILFNKVFARSQSLKLAGMMLAYATAPLLGATNYTLLLWLSAGISFITLGVTFLLPYKSKRVKHASQPVEPFFQTLSQATKDIKHNKQALIYVIALGILTGIIGTMEEYTPLFYSNIGVPIDAIPLWLAAGLVLSSLVGWFAHRLSGLRFVTVALFVVGASAVLFAGTTYQLIGPVAMLIFMRIIMLAQTLFGASMQHVIQDNRRATIGSLASFSGQVVSLGIFGVAIILFNNFSQTTTYQILAVGFVALGLLLVVMGGTRHLRVTPPRDGEALPLPGPQLKP
ncbi:MAG TPA: MFS transporter [Verrucomicrobiae bacterium]|nr:MFS transporter [Verrucomicrobiae bacterium]